MNDWILPITLIPGAGLLIMSTTQLGSALGTEINQLILQEDKMFGGIIQRKIRQLRLLSWTLFALYVASAAFALAGLIGGLEAGIMIHAATYTFVLIFLGTIGILGGLVMLLIFAFRAVTIKQDQFERQLAAHTSNYPTEN